MYIDDMRIPDWLFLEADDQRRVDLARSQMRLACKRAIGARLALDQAEEEARQSVSALVLAQLPFDLLQKYQESCEAITEAYRHSRWQSFTAADMEDIPLWIPPISLDKDLPTFPRHTDT